MKRTLLATAVLIGLKITAQPVFTSADFTLPFGPSPLVHSTDYVAPGPATAGFTFDVSTSVLGPGAQGQLMEASASPYASYFPQATMASTALTNPSLYSYSSVSTTEYLNWGYYSPNGSAIYTNPEKVYEFPLSYGTNWNDNFSGTVSSQGIDMSRAGTIAGAYNGHGTIIMPFGTFNNVARIQLTQTYTDTYQGVSTSSQVITVAYVKGGQPTALFTSSDILVDFGGGFEPYQTISSIIAPEGVGILETEAGRINALLFPNPANDQVTITLSDAAADDLEVHVFDATGRTVRLIGGAETSRAQVITLDVNDLIPGAYYVRLQDRSGANCTMPLIVD